MEALTGGDRSRWLQWTELAYEQLAELHQPPVGERAVVLRQTGELIGMAGLVPSMGPFHVLPSWAGRRPQGISFELGLFYEIAPDHRRRGYAAEAARALVGHALGSMGVARVIATTTYDNDASMGVMRTLGMRLERNPGPDPHWFQVVGVLDAGN